MKRIPLSLVFCMIILALLLSTCTRIGQPGLVVMPGAVSELLETVASRMAVDSHNYSPALIVVIALESLLFIAIGLWRFIREEF